MVDVQQKWDIYSNFYLGYQMDLCVKEDWISGLWMLVVGNVLLVSGLVTVLLVQPLLSMNTNTQQDTID